MPNPDKLAQDLPTTKPRAQAPVAKAEESTTKRKPASLLPRISLYDFKVPSRQIDAALGIPAAKDC